jgi:methylmalonyl-CoA/ethylmalonyl-CoA epimerase
VEAPDHGKSDILAPVSPQMVPDLASIGQVAITVKELQRAIRFYRDALGLRFLFETPEMAFFDCGGMRLMLGYSTHGDATYSSIIYYNTADIQGTVDLLRGQGVQFDAPPRMVVKMPDHNLWMAFFHDSEGNLAALMSEVG